MTSRLFRGSRGIEHNTALCAFGWDDGSTIHLWRINGKYVVYARGILNGKIDHIEAEFLRECTQDLFRIALPSDTVFITTVVKAQTEVLAIGTVKQHKNNTVRYAKREK